jgi:hypothetical protein
MENRQKKIECQVADLHAAIAARIQGGDDYPVRRALENLGRWQRQFDGVLPAAYSEWRELLESNDIGRVVEILLGADEDSVRRRSNSPFTGILSSAERREIMRHAA